MDNPAIHNYFLIYCKVTTKCSKFALQFVAMSKISFNIRRLRELKKLSQENLADELQITRARLGAYEEGRSAPPIEILIKLSDYFQVPIDIMVRNDLRKTDAATLMNIGNNRVLFPMIVDHENRDVIEVVTEKASAGYLNGYADPEYMEQLPSMQLPFTFTGKHRAFPVKGDSMPPVQTGDYIVGKYLEKPEEVVDGKTYILLTRNEGIVYKRLYKENLSTFTLHSDNVSYAPYALKTEDMLEIWEFVCCLKTSDKRGDEINMENMMELLRSMKVDIERLKKV